MFPNTFNAAGRSGPAAPPALGTNRVTPPAPVGSTDAPPAATPSTGDPFGGKVNNIGTGSVTNDDPAAGTGSTAPAPKALGGGTTPPPAAGGGFWSGGNWYPSGSTVDPAKAPSGMPQSGNMPDSGYTGSLGFLQNNVGQGPPDASGNPISTTYNPNLFADNATSADIAKYLGAGYSAGTSAPLTQAAPNSPFSFPNANMITGPGGQQVNAGQIAQYLRAFGGPGQQDMLRQLITNEFAGGAPAQLANGGAPNFGNTPQTPAFMAANPGVTNPNAPIAGNLTSDQLQQFVAAFGSLGGQPQSAPSTAGSQPQRASLTLGAGDGVAPPSTGNSLDPVLAALGFGNMDLYQRRRDYPQNP